MDITVKIAEQLLRLDEQCRKTEYGSIERFKIRTIRYILSRMSDMLENENLLEGMPDEAFRAVSSNTNPDLTKYVNNVGVEIAGAVNQILNEILKNKE